MRLRSLLVPLAFLGPAVAPAAAQESCRTRVVPLDGAGELRRRGEELANGVRAELGALRSTLVCRADSSRHRAVLGLVTPDVRVARSDGVPDTRADGALWAGRGSSTLVRAGVTFDWSVLHLAILPELWTSENRPFDFLPGTDPARVSLSSPFYVDRNSLDLPSRMGRDRTTQITPGQSAVWLEAKSWAVGWSSSNLWWGSGVRDALFIGPNAGGIPRTFVRTTRPIQTRAGRLSAEYFFGYVTESRFFDRDPDNDKRSLSAAALTWSPSASENVVVGIARGVMRRSPDSTASTGRAIADAWLSASPEAVDKMVALFARVVLPRSGLRAFAELARASPIVVRDLLTVPQEGLAYQVGVERLLRGRRAKWLLHVEAMNLEQGISVTDRPSRDFYTGNATPQGWTQRGQLLGAGIGPGGQSQWVSADRIAARWSLGLYGERVRWNNDALYREYLPFPNRHDVTLTAGVRAGLRAIGYDAMLDASWGRRINYLFQNNSYLPGYRTVDVRIPQLRLTLTPVAR
ncbi:MAG: hypothetical protein Q8K82_07545 [Gemmatimonadaceae bacterium]|nr:hypothetical protein [Gemmatimonadaceae bacterium]